MEEKKNLMQTLADEAFVEMFKNYENRVDMLDDCADSNLNHFWNRNKFLDFWGLGNAPYNQYYHEEKHGNGKFLLADNIRFRRYGEFYDERTYECPTTVINQGNDFVTDFFLLKPGHDLDLTWLKPHDGFRLRDNIQYRNLKNIMVNVDNLKDSSLNSYSPQYEADVDLRLNLIVNAGKSKLKSAQQVAAFRSFFEYQDKDGTYHIDHVTLDGFDKTTYNIIGSYLDEKSIPVSKRQKLNLEANPRAIKIEKMATDGLIQ